MDGHRAVLFIQKMIEQLQEIQREKEKKTVATNNNNDKSPAKDRVWFQIYAHTHTQKKYEEIAKAK